MTYYKNPRMRQLDTDIGDVHTDMVDIAIEIEHELCVEVLSIADKLKQYEESCSELDWYSINIPPRVYFLTPSPLPFTPIVAFYALHWLPRTMASLGQTFRIEIQEITAQLRSRFQRADTCFKNRPFPPLFQMIVT